MIAALPIFEAQFRLAKHYLKKLQAANATLLRGHVDQRFWQNSIELDWLQIKKWQAWTANGHESEWERAQLCTSFCMNTSDILRAKLSPSEHLNWILEGLNAAQNLADADAEGVLLFQLGIAYLNLEALDEVDKCAQQLMGKVQLTQNTLYSGQASYLLGSVNLLRGVYDVAEEHFRNAIDILTSHDALDEVARSIRGIGRIALYRGDYEAAHEYHIKFLEIAKDSGNIREVGVAHIALCGVLITLHNYSEAEYHAGLALNIAQNNGFQRMVPAALISLADTEKRQEKYAAAAKHLEEGIKYARKVSPPSTVTAGLLGLGRVCLIQGHIAKAKACYEEALTMARDAQLRFRICDVIHDMVYLQIALNDFNTSLDYLKELCLMTKQINTPHFTTQTLSVAVVLSVHTAKYEQAGIWAGLLENYMHLLDSDLFNLSVHEQLEDALGTAAYQQALEAGKILSLDEALDQISALCLV